MTYRSRPPVLRPPDPSRIQNCVEVEAGVGGLVVVGITSHLPLDACMQHAERAFRRGGILQLAGGAENASIHEGRYRCSRRGLHGSDGVTPERSSGK